MKRVTVALGIALVATAVAAAPKPKFLKTWKTPAAAGVSFAGKKVVGLIVSNDQSLRESGEEALAREMTAKGVQGIAAYRLIPKEEIRNPAHAKDFVERAGGAGVVILRLVDLSKESEPSRVTWESAAYYDTLWAGYYPYMWGAYYEITPARTEVKLVVEMVIFDVASNKLIWGGTSETTNPKDAQSYIKSLVDGAVEQMQKDGLIRKK